MKRLLIITLGFIPVLTFGQQQYAENLPPANMASGVYYQNGPGSNNGTLNWEYNYGTKLTVNAGGSSRNFELTTTEYPYGMLKFRQWDTGNSVWTPWRDVLTSNQDGKVGIGMATPLKKLDVNGSIGAQDFLVVQRGGSYLVALNGQNDGYISGRNSGFEQKFHVTSNGTTYFNGGNVGIGTAAPDSKLTVKGNIHAEEVKVDLSVPGPDYVFKEDYNLKSLEEVQNYIKEHGHLPNIPSAKKMEEDGIDLGTMNMKLLEKIEELMLYTLEQEVELKIKNMRILGIEKRLDSIETLLNQNQ